MPPEITPIRFCLSHWEVIGKEVYVSQEGQQIKEFEGKEAGKTVSNKVRKTEGDPNGKDLHGSSSRSQQTCGCDI